MFTSSVHDTISIILENGEQLVSFSVLSSSVMDYLFSDIRSKFLFFLNLQGPQDIFFM